MLLIFLSIKHEQLELLFLDFVFFVGMSIGAGVSGEISSEFGYEVIYGAGAALQLLAIFYAVFFVKESKKLQAYKNMVSSNSSTTKTTEDSQSSNSKTIEDSQKNKENSNIKIASCMSIFSLSQ